MATPATRTALGQAIKDMGLTARRVAVICDLHYKTVEGYMKAPPHTGARKPSKDILHHICNRLGLDETQFPHGEDQINVGYVRSSILRGMDDDFVPCMDPSPVRSVPHPIHPIHPIHPR